MAAVRHYLEFERPIADLEAKIEELSKLSDTAGPGAFEPRSGRAARAGDRVAP